MESDRHYDLILIGSGMGSLTVASLMATLRGQRVLVLERHFKAGGFTHSFQRQGFHWDVGVHYVGQMHPGSMPRRWFDLVTHQGVQWQKMPEPFEKFIYPGLKFEVYGTRSRYEADLCDRFPEEKGAIRRYFRDVSRATGAFLLETLGRNSNGALKLATAVGKWGLGFDLTTTTEEYLDRHFQDPRLKGLLVSQWGDYGMPPAQSPFAIHATIVQHYLEGAYYPVGGAEAIAASIKPIVERQGGQFLLQREVSEILTEDGKAIGVRVRGVKGKEEQYFAPVIVSNVGAVNTYLKLLVNHPIAFRSALESYSHRHRPATEVSLYLGLSEDPRHLGFRGENYWIYARFDHNEIFARRGEWVDGGKPAQIYLSFPSLKDPEAKKHTAEAIVFTDYDCFAPWRDRPWRHRGEDYEQLKQRITQSIIEAIEGTYPGFAKAIAYAELSTPLTNEYFTAHPQGGIYGLAFAPERWQSENAAWTKIKTPVAGLYLTGADVYMGGIFSAMLSGMMTATQLPDGISWPTLVAAARGQRSPANV